MAGIKYTLSRDRRYRAETPEQERAWLSRVHKLHYALPSHPTKAGEGDFVYFIHGGKVKARARIAGIVAGQARPTYTGKMRKAAPFDLVVKPPMEVTRLGPKHRGFQGFRYITDAEREAFENAFT